MGKVNFKNIIINLILILLLILIIGYNVYYFIIAPNLQAGTLFTGGYYVV